uniref:MH2 domain-containing protein n=1 Tax=Heterorhabditis bacteriophora TaxID=37862 RepID=A0A1I7WGF1_HETBA
MILSLENSGTRPLFLCMSASSSKPDTLRRLSPGYCIRVHKGEATASAPASERAAHTQRRDPALSHGNLVISVGKGWGPNYSRLFVTDIPCRYEALVSTAQHNRGDLHTVLFRCVVLGISFWKTTQDPLIVGRSHESRNAANVQASTYAFKGVRDCGFSPFQMINL